MNPLLNLIAGPVIDAVGKIIDRVIPDKAAAEKAKLEFAAVQQSQEYQLALQQIIVNVEEARHPSIFVSGWRPCVGWVGAAGLAYAAILEPLARFAAALAGYSGAFPALDTTITMQLLFGLLGLGAYRTYEKGKGVAAK
ncbi:MAG: 3TM-type holin [Gallionella sp.]